MRYSDGSGTGARLTIDYTDISFLCHHESVLRNKGMWGNTEIGVVIYGMARIWYFCFSFTLVFTITLVLERVQRSECTKYE